MIHLFALFSVGVAGVSIWGGLLSVLSAAVSSHGKGTTALASLANSWE